MDAIYIGEKTNPTYFSAISTDIKNKDGRYIAENSEEYWSHSCIFNTSVKIRKSSRLGNDIKNIIISDRDADKIFKMIDLEILKNHILIEDVYMEIENLKKEFVNLGKKEKIAEIKHTLGIY